jgi:hypothetical protein
MLTGFQGNFTRGSARWQLWYLLSSFENTLLSNNMLWIAETVVAVLKEISFPYPSPTHTKNALVMSLSSGRK